MRHKIRLSVEILSIVLLTGLLVHPRVLYSTVVQMYRFAVFNKGEKILQIFYKSNLQLLVNTSALVLPEPITYERKVKRIPLIV